ncbi:F-box protein CPR1-like [Arachis stenosperma]|uniref:F-box protein CPR1-like n=1 Tax=Arachis stenosperma TaxID=217475 RepID=UPI0025ABA096|nr:F-box protein CPR1-like [Arachis stenosperma]
MTTKTVTNHKAMLSLCILSILLLLLMPLTTIANNKIRISSKLRLPEKLSITDHLPQELVSNILSRLPAKELWRCKFVCKSWFHLINDPNFVTNYYVVYNNSNHNHSHLLLIQRPSLSSNKTFISVLSCNNATGSVSSQTLNLPCEYNSDHKYWTEIMGPCNGIYFLEGNPNMMMNPSLGQFKALPESHFTTPIGTNSLSDYAGFGFDSKANDYKVVVIKDLWNRETDQRRLWCWTAELFSLNSNSWRKLDAPLPSPIEISASSRVYTYENNCCHWLGYVEDEFGKRKDVVLSFDMVNEAFRKINVPRVCKSSIASFATLVPFEESASIGVVVRGKEKRYDVWMMKDYWDEESWVKLYSVGHVEVISRLVGFYKSNQLLWKGNDERLVMYERDSQQVKDLHVYVKNDSLRAARYMETLVSLQRGH